MKKARRLLLLLPVIGAAFYLRSLASWRPKKVFAVQGRVARLVFSGDGKTLLVCYAPPPSGFYLRSPTLPATRIVALDVRDGFRPLWEHNTAPFDQDPQFFKGDSQILLQVGLPNFVRQADTQILDARSGKIRKTYKHLSGIATTSPDGRWLAFHPSFHWLDRHRTDNHLYLNPTDSPSRRAASAERVIGKNSDWSCSNAFSFSPDGQTLAVGVSDKSGSHLEFYNTRTWKLIRMGTGTKRSGQGEDPIYETMRWSRDGQTVFASHSAVSGKITLQSWRARDGKIASGSLSEFYRAASPSFSFEDDGHVLSFNGDGEVHRSKTPLPYTDFYSLLRLPNESIYVAALSPDGSTLAAGTSVGSVYSQRVR